MKTHYTYKFFEDKSIELQKKIWELEAENKALRALSKNEDKFYVLVKKLVELLPNDYTHIITTFEFDTLEKALNKIKMLKEDKYPIIIGPLCEINVDQ